MRKTQLHNIERCRVEVTHETYMGLATVLLLPANRNWSQCSVLWSKHDQHLLSHCKAEQGSSMAKPVVAAVPCIKAPSYQYQSG